MALKGLYVIPENPTSPEFLNVQQLFHSSCQLVRRYRLLYTVGPTHEIESEEWTEKLYYHGTGHWGHFFTSRLSVAMGYALQRKPLLIGGGLQGDLMALFLCQVRNIKKDVFRFVAREEDIVPRYLAIARKNHQ
ncbi:hypothetical protein BGW39_010295 [Mortierella sp. 14UC]|nr:hypothetical protein BGW39_010295 [Mortierella sp. 14UC]